MADDFAGLKRKSKKGRSQAAEDIVLPGAEDLRPKEPEVEDAAPAPTSSVPLPEDQPLDDFSDLKKKKKKKVTLDLDDAPAEAAPAEPSMGDEAPMDDFSDLKKKRKKKVVIDDGALDAPAADEPASEDFSDLKKKKGKSKKTAFDMEAFEKELELTEGAAPGSDDEVDAGADDEPEGENPFGADQTDETKSAAEIAAEQKLWLQEPTRDYQYVELLGRFFGLLHESHPSLGAGARKKQAIPPPSMHRDGTKRSVFANVAEICKKMRREPEHVIQFLFAELGTTGSVDAGGRLVIKGRFQQKQIENVLRRYIIEYVTCKTCKSPDTQISKENRLLFITCSTCGSHRSVQTIQAGFKAQVAKRRAMAAKANP